MAHTRPPLGPPGGVNTAPASREMTAETVLWLTCTFFAVSVSFTPCRYRLMITDSFSGLIRRGKGSLHRYIEYIEPLYLDALILFV